MRELAPRGKGVVAPETSGPAPEAPPGPNVGPENPSALPESPLAAPETAMPELELPPEPRLTDPPVESDFPKSNWLSGRYSNSASDHNAYWDSGERVFPTRRNSGLSGEALRAEQAKFVENGLRAGRSPGELRGRAAAAGYERRGGMSTEDHLADRPTEKLLQKVIAKLEAEEAEIE